MVTAKIKCTSLSVLGEGDVRQVNVAFSPDYTDGRNKEWAAATPSLNLSMTLKGAVGDRFQSGKSYTLTFTEDAEDETAAGA